ncbi:hypothetical protein ACR9YC_12155 [Parasphingorhabdus sp. DH2-15]|uniref:hypothetical protein n=1 Tax=Parasphingorhabdus sp. DH2-15 TaxID=3444112 RepID=UPI003F6887A6
MPTVSRSLARTVLAFAIGILLVTLHNPSYGKARKHEVLDPIGQWEVTSDRIQCTATRAFGDPKAPTTLILQKNGLGSDFYVEISGRIAKLTAWDEEAALSFGSQFGEHIISYDSGRFGCKHSLKFNSGLRIDIKAAAYFEEDGQNYADWLAENTALEREAQGQVKSISIRNAGRWDIDLNSGSLADVFLLLDNCMQKMIANMGLNIAEQKQLK